MLDKSTFERDYETVRGAFFLSLLPSWLRVLIAIILCLFGWGMMRLMHYSLVNSGTPNGMWEVLGIMLTVPIDFIKFILSVIFAPF